MPVDALRSPEKKTPRYAKRDEEERQAFQERLAALDEEQVVWVDECGVEQGLYRLPARRPRGVPIMVDIEDKRFAPRIVLMSLPRTANTSYTQHYA